MSKINGRRVSIQIENEFCSLEVQNKALEFGKLYRIGDVVELNTELARYKLKDFEAYLEESKIPYTLYEGGNHSFPPRVKKYIPKFDYCKQIDCYAFTGQEDGDEDGIIAVSKLEEIMEKATKENIVDMIRDLIKENSFKYDKIA